MIKQYLGDSVYAAFDGYNNVLTTENGYPDDPRNRIVIEPDVYSALVKYYEKLRSNNNEQQKQSNERKNAP